MISKSKNFLYSYYQILIAYTVTICFVRGFEYFSLANKSFVSNTYTYELLGIVYDVWICLIYGFVLLLPVYLISLLSNKLAKGIFHLLNIVLLVNYICLIIVFSERNNPFDHEFFTRKSYDTWTTVKQMMTSGFSLYIPFLLYIPFYFLVYFKWAKTIHFKQPIFIVLLSCTVLAAAFFKFSNPSQSLFKSAGAYYLTTNKLTYWIADSYNYFQTKDKYDASKLSAKELTDAIDFYQQNQPFEFTNKEYPLLHKASTQDVLGSFFNLDSVPKV